MRKRNFVLGLFIYAAILLLLIFAGLFLFWQYIAAYEFSRVEGVMDGYAATRAIRALDRPDAPKVPIIALTANTFSDDVRNAMESGMNAHLPKPLDPDILIRTLKQWIL